MAFMLRSLDRSLLRTAGSLLLVIGVVKLASAVSRVSYLSLPDPLLPFLSNRTVLVLAGIIEVPIACQLLLFPEKALAKQSLIALIATFSIYRLGLVALDVSQPCPCLGRASDWLHITPRQADSLALLLLLGLSATAAVSLCISFIARARTREPSARIPDAF